MFWIVTLLLTANDLFAGGSGDGFTSLLPAFLNFGILLSFLIWKLSKPLKNHFNNKSDTIKTILDRANVKAKEAEMMMQIQKEKISGLEKEINGLRQSMVSEFENFKARYTSEVEQRIQKLKEDANLKIEAEKSQQLNALNESMLSNVILKSKEIIKNDNSLAIKATNRALEGIQG